MNRLFVALVLMLAGCATTQPRIVEHADRPPPQMIPVSIPCVSLKELPKVPTTAVTKEIVERVRVAVKELSGDASSLTPERYSQDVTDVIDLMYRLLVDLTKLEQYSVEADARLTGCLSDAKEVKP